jgi:threonine dehydrogenase-like Zn-dependent dehydrogenase
MMRGLVYRGSWNVAVEDVPEPDPPKGTDVLVRIHATGICGTDIGIVSGAYSAKAPVILGHESAGQVVAVGEDVRELAAGDRVVIDPTYYCGFCLMCRTDRQNHCERKSETETGVSRDGTFAAYYTTEERFLHRFASNLSYEEAALTEPLSCVLTGIGQLRLRHDLRTLVIGAGPIGILYAHGLSLAGIDGVLVEIADERLSLVQHAIPARWQTERNIPGALKALRPRTGEADLIVDTTSAATEQCTAVLAPRGQLLSVGLRAGSANLDMLRVADRSLTILGSIDSLGTFSSALRLIERRAVPADRIITDQLDLEHYGEAFRRVGCDIAARRRSNNARALKTIIRPV